ncbi:hypothetical protein FNO01nite_21480 [Flavobacterium noncentrifugens]|nr:hypothetical protein FNO01nite_21480 [Flavobacterium noncentrifugens]
MELNGNYSDFNNDGLLNAGDTVNYQMTIVNRTNINCTMVTATSISMNIIGSFIDLLPAGTSNNSAYSGIHVITQREIDNGYINGFILLSGRNLNRTTQSVIPYSYQLTSSGMMTFNAFLDTNNNNVKDASEVDFSRGGFQYDTNNSMHNITSGAHLSLQDNNLSNTYNVGFVVDGDVAANYTISPAAYFNVSVPASGISNYNFAVHASPYTDVSTKIYAYTQPRPGFRYVNEVLFTNNSPVTLSSGNLLFTKDPLLTITDISAPDAIRTETGFSLSFSDLQPFETRQVRVTCQVPVMPTVNLGDQLTNTVTANLPAGDINTSNNNDSLTMTVIGAYDPNNKMESHGGKILHAAFGADDYLTYTIRFENTGTAHAINVKVEDMLDEKLDPASVKMTATSSNCFLDRVDNKLTWTFAAINLPPSVENTDVGKGYIAFQVKPKPGFAIGDIIPNTAEIYFDFNPAIVTDICTTEFVSALAAADFDSFGFSSYPNPVQDNWTIFSDKQLIDSVQFYDVSGKIIHSETVKNIKTTIDLSFLSNGLYFAKVISDGKSKTFKLIKA